MKSVSNDAAPRSPPAAAGGVAGRVHMFIPRFRNCTDSTHSLRDDLPSAFFAKKKKPPDHYEGFRTWPTTRLQPLITWQSDNLSVFDGDRPTYNGRIERRAKNRLRKDKWRSFSLFLFYQKQMILLKRDRSQEADIQQQVTRNSSPPEITVVWNVSSLLYRTDAISRHYNNMSLYINVL